jgi:hypothetical protein
MAGSLGGSVLNHGNHLTCFLEVERTCCLVLKTRMNLIYTDGQGKENTICMLIKTH